MRKCDLRAPSCDGGVTLINRYTSLPLQHLSARLDTMTTGRLDSETARYTSDKPCIEVNFLHLKATQNQHYYVTEARADSIFFAHAPQFLPVVDAPSSRKWYTVTASYSGRVVLVNE